MKKRGVLKAQASLEFIMTYGWAIMIVLVSIGSLSYFGVLNPDEFLPSRCILEFGIVCVDFKVQEDAVTLVLFNGRKEEIQIPSINVTGCTGTASGSLKIKEQEKFVVGGCSNTGRKFSGQVNVTYIGRSDLEHTNIGAILARVESGCGLCACQNIDTNCGSYPTCSNCNSQDNYGANYCSGNDIVRDFNDYSCSSNQCDLSAAPETVENCASSNGICQSASCVCADTASSCGTYPACSNCGTNKMCYQLGCLWDLNGEWTITYPTQGNKRVNLVQIGNYVEAILIDDLNPGPNPGDWAVRFTISGDSISGDANNQPDVYSILPYRGTITTGGTYIDAEFEYIPNSGNWFALDISKN